MRYAALRRFKLCDAGSYIETRKSESRPPDSCADCHTLIIPQFWEKSSLASTRLNKIFILFNLEYYSVNVPRSSYGQLGGLAVLARLNKIAVVVQSV